MKIIALGKNECHLNESRRYKKKRKRVSMHCRPLISFTFMTPICDIATAVENINSVLVFEAEPAKVCKQESEDFTSCLRLALQESWPAIVNGEKWYWINKKLLIGLVTFIGTIATFNDIVLSFSLTETEEIKFMSMFEVG